MRSNIVLIAILLYSSISNASQLDMSDWKAGTPAIHGPIKDQGNTSFCWAFAYTSFLESKLMIEKNIFTELSPIYVAKAKMIEDYASGIAARLTSPNETANLKDLSFFGRYKALQKDKILYNSVRPIIENELVKNNPSNETNDLLSIDYWGVVPSQVYQSEYFNMNFPTSVSGDNPPYVNRYDSPDIEGIFEKLMRTKFFNQDIISRYTGEDATRNMEYDFDKLAGNKPIYRDDQFEFNNKIYNPISFLSDYIGFGDDSFKVFDIKSYRLDIGALKVQAQLDQGKPVLLWLMLLDDTSDESGPNEGVWDPSLCDSVKGCNEFGGHFALIVNSLKDKNGKIKAFIIQNSWGPQGTDIQGKKTKIRADKGYNIVTLDYLKKGAEFQEDKIAFEYIIF